MRGGWLDVAENGEPTVSDLEPFPTDAGLLVIVPSRGRPESVARVTQAWRETDAYQAASLVFAIDEDDPRCGEYYDIAQCVERPGIRQVSFMAMPKWLPMVHKLNECATAAAGSEPGWGGIAFAGDDHLPCTVGWASTMLAALREMGTGIVYGNDLLQGERLCTSWAMTSDIVRALGRMVPAPVEHMYCDNSVMDLGREAGCLRYLPDVVIEHCHPLAGKAEWDAGYARVNRAEQYQRDEAAYLQWCGSGRDADVAMVKALGGSDGAVCDRH